MSWLDKLRRKKPQNTTYADMLNGFTPIFSQFGDNIYASDVVQQAIRCIVQEMKKLKPTHIRENGSDKITVRGNIQTILDKPNEIMTTSDFLEKIVWQLFFNYNCFVLPTFYVWKDERGAERRQYTGLYPLAPTQVDFIQDASGTLYVNLKFANNYETTIRYSDIIHIRYDYSVSEYMGGDENGQPDHRALLEVLQLNKDLLTGISKGMRSSFAINGVVRFNTLLDGGKTEAALKELETKLQKSESGFLPLDLKSEFVPIKKEIQLVDEKTLEFIDTKILRQFGVPLCILTGDYNKAQYEAFYQKTLEPLIISIGQAFTRTLFTDRERAYGNRVVLYPKDLIFMSVDQTLEMIRLLGDSGALYENEKRVAVGLPPLAELEGVRMQSLNYANVDMASTYQLGKTAQPSNDKNGGGQDEG